MDINNLYKEIEAFSKETHGASNFHKDEVFVKGLSKGHYAPLSFLTKKIPEIKEPASLMAHGFVFDSYELTLEDDFQDWYETQFSRKLVLSVAKEIALLHLPNNKDIFAAIEQVHSGYQVLRQSQILLNGKNLPVQLGEWYAKCIFGLKQEKSTSQRGFDFFIKDKRVEVKIHWTDQSSPKGVKIRKSLVELSDYCAVMYVAKNFMIREVCFLDSEFILRKFATKGHTVFLKDSDISQYFFSKSSKHLDKVANSTALLKYAAPNLAMNLAEHFSKDHT